MKIDLNPGESKEVTFELNKRDFSFFDSRRHLWIAESGDFDLLVGSSSKDIKLKETVKLNSTEYIPAKFDEMTFYSEFLWNPKTHALTIEYFADWIKVFAGPNQKLDDVWIEWFFINQPIAKMPYITEGKISKEKVEEFLKKAQELDKP